MSDRSPLAGSRRLLSGMNGAARRGEAEPRRSKTGGLRMEMRFLGNSGLKVSALAFGTMTFGGKGHFRQVGSVQVEEARRHVDLCLEAGGKPFDTPGGYSQGASEEILGQALRRRR